MRQAAGTHDWRRRSIELSYVNAALWGLGNGLASTTLVIYLAYELRAPRVALGVALLRAAPQMIGLLRLAAPAMIGSPANRRRFCVSCFVVSAVVLLLMPAVVMGSSLYWLPASLWLLVGMWSLYHLLEYLGTVALWSWLADLVPLRVRGSFIGRRNVCLLWGGIAGMLLSGGLVEAWRRWSPASESWLGYAWAITLGAVMLAAATIPLARMAPAIGSAQNTARSLAAQLLRPLADGRYLRLIGVGIWLSFFNGLTQSAQFLYPAAVLGVSVLTMHALSITTELGQSAISPWLGRVTDRMGNRPVMAICQAVVATGPLFYAVATPHAWWWLIGAAVAWIAFAGLNIGLPGLMLKLAPAQDRSAYVASYFAVTGVAYALSTVAGGAIHDACRMWHGTIPGLHWEIGYYQAAFCVGAAGRGTGALLLLLLVEPENSRADSTE